ncbi:hypothetical protein [Arenimonas caeni]|uniref:Uncharacterized protein n=2 Tax=Arenimonas caeni TaxID=2058085 RepID=A0A2P6MBJ7_9GAMM|nr:hypothetical protein [Arenimonas caeni]PRH83349.1 hypothetical protein C6N40_04165 [Arenimonas caeni]
MDETQGVDDLPGSFGYGAGVLYGLPQPPRWMGQVQPDLHKVLLLMAGGDMLYGHLSGLDWEGGNVILRVGEETLSNPIADLRGILLSGREKLGRPPVAPTGTITSTLRYRDGGDWMLQAHAVHVDLFGAGFFTLADGLLHAVFVPWRVLADNELTLRSGLSDHQRARIQREVAFRRGADIDRLQNASLERVPGQSRDDADIRRSAFAKAFCKALGG